MPINHSTFATNLNKLSGTALVFIAGFSTLGMLVAMALIVVYGGMGFDRVRVKWRVKREAREARRERERELLRVGDVWDMA